MLKQIAIDHSSEFMSVVFIFLLYVILPVVISVITIIIWRLFLKNKAVEDSSEAKSLWNSSRLGGYDWFSDEFVKRENVWSIFYYSFLKVLGISSLLFVLSLIIINNQLLSEYLINFFDLSLKLDLFYILIVLLFGRSLKFLKLFFNILKNIESERSKYLKIGVLLISDLIQSLVIYLGFVLLNNYL